MKLFIRGLKSGIPIGIGYFSVSFTFGILAVSYGFYWWQALLISMTTLTSAGQLAAIGIMVNPAQYAEMIISQLTINLRYSFMSISLSQKTAPEFRGIKRWIFGFFMTDEIFAVASAQNEVTTSFFAGLTVAPYIGWTLGTLFGSILGNVLPSSIMNALCIAIYGMFVAIVIPQARKEKSVALCVAVAIALSCAFTYIPFINRLSSGFVIIICSVISSAIFAILSPLPEENSIEEVENND